MLLLLPEYRQPGFAARAKADAPPLSWIRRFFYALRTGTRVRSMTLLWVAMRGTFGSAGPLPGLQTRMCRPFSVLQRNGREFLILRKGAKS
jgi:hypothetical protein